MHWQPTWNTSTLSFNIQFFSIFLLCLLWFFLNLARNCLCRFFLILIRLPSSLVYNGIIPDSSILYPDFIREYYSSLTLNRIMPRLIRMFIRSNSSARSELEPACHENDGKKHYRLEYETSVHWMLPWIFLLGADDKILTRTLGRYMSASSRDVACFFLKNENDEKRYELWFETIANVHAPLLRISI